MKFEVSRRIVRTLSRVAGVDSGRISHVLASSSNLSTRARKYPTLWRHVTADPRKPLASHLVGWHEDGVIMHVWDIVEGVITRISVSAVLCPNQPFVCLDRRLKRASAMWTPTQPSRDGTDRPNVRSPPDRIRSDRLVRLQTPMTLSHLPAASSQSVQVAHHVPAPAASQTIGQLSSVSRTLRFKVL